MLRSVASSYCAAMPLFGGRERQSYYLEKFEQLSGPKQQTLSELYRMATEPMGPGMKGVHVSKAFAQAGFEVINGTRELLPIILQVASLYSKLSRLDREGEEAQQILEKLNDFHVACRSFVTGEILEDAEVGMAELKAKREYRKRPKGMSNRSSDREVLWIRLFRNKMKPVHAANSRAKKRKKLKADA